MLDPYPPTHHRPHLLIAVFEFSSNQLAVLKRISLQKVSACFFSEDMGILLGVGGHGKLNFYETLERLKTRLVAA